MPGAVPRTSTFALTNATLPYVKSLADLGWEKALAKDAGLSRGLNVHGGKLTHEAVASALGLPFETIHTRLILQSGTARNPTCAVPADSPAGLPALGAPLSCCY